MAIAAADAAAAADIVVAVQMLGLEFLAAVSGVSTDYLDQEGLAQRRESVPRAAQAFYRR